MNDLTNEQINVKVALALGWTDIRWTGGFITPRTLTGRIPYDSQRLPIPGYSTDLNACASFEKELTNDEYWGINTSNKDSFIYYVTGGRTISASPRQRCLAFLRTKGIE